MGIGSLISPNFRDGNASGRRNFPIRMFFIQIGKGKTSSGDALSGMDSSWARVEKLKNASERQDKLTLH